MLIAIIVLVCITFSSIKYCNAEFTKNVTADLMAPMFSCLCEPACNGRTVCNTVGKCYILKDKLTGSLRRGCLRNVKQSLMSCYSNAKVGYFKCCQGHMCNLNMTVAPTLASGIVNSSLMPTLLIIGLVALSACIIIVAAVYLVHRHISRHKSSGLLLTPEVKPLDEDSLYMSFHDSSKQDQWSSGSGSGLLTLVPQTVGKQVTLLERIGKGRFGEVWRGKWLDEDVAVKTFSSLDEISWKQETDIYNTGMLHHENILAYYASDTVGILSCTQNWLILQYHGNGSLYDYLQRSDIDTEEMLVLAHSIAAGLAHLHTEIKEGTGKHEKPAIAHRDIKSKNILVKDNGQCCIGDLGHAIKNNHVSINTEAGKLLVGTKRYMAPEVLAETVNAESFESFKCVDVYAFGLVLWEIARRTRPFAEEYRIPFWDLVSADPSFEDMKRVVVLEKHRPPIANRWSQDPLMCEVAKLMSGCWAHSPKVRLNILRVKKNLYNLMKSTSGHHMDTFMKMALN
ncbi:hypothetical protein BsWGS_24037 [Bradybaena similaris]